MPRSRGLTLPAVAGALLAPALVTVALLVLGYRLVGTPLPLWLALAALGAGLAVAVAVGLRVAPSLAVVALAVLLANPVFGGPPPGSLAQFAADAVFLTVAAGLVAAAEYRLTHPDAMGRLRLDTPAARRAALAGAATYPLLAVGIRFALGLGWYRAGGVFTVVATGWILVGAALVGAAVAVARSEYGLLTPALVVVGALAVGAFDAWRFAASSAAGVGPTLLTLVLVGWFAPLLAALAAGAAEHRVRTAFHSGTAA